MAGQIVSASVGGATAGGVVIPEPVGAAYATWPDLVKKEVADIFSIFNDRLERGGDDPDDDRVMYGRSPSTPATAKAAVFGLPVLLLIGVLVFLLWKR
jgi:hypothetical protein